MIQLPKAKTFRSENGTNEASFEAAMAIAAPSLS